MDIAYIDEKVVMLFQNGFDLDYETKPCADMPDTVSAVLSAQRAVL